MTELKGFGSIKGDNTGEMYPSARRIHTHLFLYFDDFPTRPQAEYFIKGRQGKLSHISPSTKKPMYLEYIIIPYKWELKGKQSTTYAVYQRYAHRKPKGA
jgi:hypothetical protein